MHGDGTGREATGPLGEARIAAITSDRMSTIRRTRICNGPQNICTSYDANPCGRNLRGASCS
jgi:hypothetical protein